MSHSAAVSPDFTLAGSAAPAPAFGSVAAVTGRLLLAPLFLLSGASKLTAPSATIDMIAASGLPFATLGFALAVLVELVGGLALVLGYRTRIVASALAGFTVAAAIAFHSDLGDQNQFIHFFKNITIAGGLLQLVAFGGGRLSLDARRR